MFEVLLICILALCLDWLFGEPRRFHPLVGFGNLAVFIETKLNNSTSTPIKRFFMGLLANLLLLLPITIFSYWVEQLHSIQFTASVLIVMLCIGHKSLHEHTVPIAEALSNDAQETARQLTSQIVSRDPETLNIPKATIESILENGSDSVFAALFWFLIAGLPGIIFYRLANTLDAMWGYKTSRFLYFGRFSARLDDVLNYIPARLTALSYSVLGNSKTAFTCWFNQAKHWESPNAGPVMAAGAGALQLELGGPAQYHGKWHQRPILGLGNEPAAEDISRSLRLIRHSCLLWLTVFFLLGVLNA